MKIKLINWPTSNGKVWIVSESVHGYTPIKELDTNDINSELAQRELAANLTYFETKKD